MHPKNWTLLIVQAPISGQLILFCAWVVAISVSATGHGFNCFIRDLDLLTIGMVNDMYAESRNDDYNYATVATQSDYDAF